MSIAIVSECLTDESNYDRAVTYRLDEMLSIAGIRRRECYETVVFNFRPRGGDVKNLCGKKTDGVPNLPPLLRGKYLRREHGGEIERLNRQLLDAKPNVIIALGTTALWALSGEMGIRSTRGVTRLSNLGIKLLPTYDPGAAMRQYTLRPIIIADFEKAKRQSAFPEYRVPERRIHIPETLDEILAFERDYFTGSPLACDIETKQDQITCIGFSPDPSLAIVLPFFCHSGANYWQTKADELAVWGIIRRWLEQYPTIYQNGVFDMSYLWRVYGIPAPRATEDTMLKHHAIQPELEKGLGFLASLYTDEPSWKHMGKGLKHD